MAWGDDDPILVKPKASPRPAASWGNDDPALTAGPAKKSFKKGFVEEFSRPYENVGRWARKAADAAGLDTSGIQGISKNLQEAQAEADEAHAKLDPEWSAAKPSATGKVLGGMAGTAPLALVTQNPWLFGAGQGGLTTEHPDDAGAVALDMATGAALNKAGGVALDKLASVTRPVIDPAVRMLKDAGVRLTPGQVKGGKAMIREDKAMSRPRVGEAIATDRAQSIEDFNRGAVNRALLPLGVRVPDNIKTGHDAVAFMQDAVKTAYDKITPNLSLKPDARMGAGFRKAGQVLADLPEREADIFQKVIGNRIDFSQGAMTGRQLSAALRDVRKAASGYSRSASEAERQLGEALSHVDDALHNALGAQNPGYAKALKATNLAYRGDRIVSDAAKMADEGIASTGQLKSSVRQNDRSKNARKSAAGRAHMQDYAEAGRKVLPAKTPDSGTAGRQQAGKWLPEIRGAIDAAGYKADKAYTDFLLAPRPAWAKKLGGFLEDLGPQSGLIAGGLLTGLRPRDE